VCGEGCPENFRISALNAVLMGLWKGNLGCGKGGSGGNEQTNFLQGVKVGKEGGDKLFVAVRKLVYQLLFHYIKGVRVCVWVACCVWFSTACEFPVKTVNFQKKLQTFGENLTLRSKSLSTTE